MLYQLSENIDDLKKLPDGVYVRFWLENDPFGTVSDAALLVFDDEESASRKRITQFEIIEPMIHAVCSPVITRNNSFYHKLYCSIRAKDGVLVTATECLKVGELQAARYFDECHQIILVTNHITHEEECVLRTINKALVEWLKLPLFMIGLNGKSIKKPKLIRFDGT
jgi:hypothetical protein